MPNMKRMAAGQAAAASVVVALRLLLLAALVVAAPPRAATATTSELLEETAAQSPSPSPSTLLSWNKDPKVKRFLEKFTKVEHCVEDIDALYAVMRSSSPAKCASSWLKVLSDGSLIGPKCCHAVRVAYWLSDEFGHLLPPVADFDEEAMYYVLFLCFRRYNYDKDHHLVPPPNHHP